MKKRVIAFISATIMATVGLTSCNNGLGINPDGTYTWKMALNSSEGDNAYDTGALFAQKVEELTNGRVTVDLYGGGSLGTIGQRNIDSVRLALKREGIRLMKEDVGGTVARTLLFEADTGRGIIRSYGKPEVII